MRPDGNITSVTGQKGRADLPDTSAGDDIAWFGAFFRTYYPVMVSAAYNRMNNRAGRVPWGGVNFGSLCVGVTDK